MAAERYYNCPRCNQKVSAVSPLAGAVCLECNNVSNWQSTMVQIANAMRNDCNGDPAKMMSVAKRMLQNAGIYDRFMTLYGAHLMSSFMPQNSHNTQAHNHNQSSVC